MTSLMLVTVFVAFAPTAQSAISSSAEVQTFKGNATTGAALSTSQSPHMLNITEWFTVSVSVNATFAVTDGCTGLTADVTADLRPFGAGYTAATVIGTATLAVRTGTTTWGGTVSKNFDVKANPTGPNGVVQTSITPTVTVRCTSGTATDTISTSNSGFFVLDSRPALVTPAAVLTSGNGGVGSTINVTFGVPQDLVSFRIVTGEIDPSYARNGQLLPAAQLSAFDMTVQNTGVDAPVAYIYTRDGKSNYEHPIALTSGITTLDARIPAAPTVTVNELHAGPSRTREMKLSWNQPDPDVHSYTLYVMDNNTGVNRSFVTATTNYQFLATTHTWLTSNTPFTITIVAADERQTSAVSAPRWVRTHPEPVGEIEMYVVSTPPGQTPGSVGTVLEFRTANLVDVRNISVDIAGISPSIINWSSDFGTPKQVTIVDTGALNSVSLPNGWAYGSDTNRTVAPLRDYTNGAMPFDPNAPGPILSTSLSARALANGSIEIRFENASELDLDYHELAYRVKDSGAAFSTLRMRHASPDAMPDGLKVRVYRLPPSLFTNGVTYEFHVTSVDARGNRAPTVPPLSDPAITATPGAPLEVKIIESKPDSPFLTKPPAVSGTWRAANSFNVNSSNINLTLLNRDRQDAGQPAFWDGTGWSATRVPFWTTNNATGTWFSDAFTGYTTLPSGRYAIQAHIRDWATNQMASSDERRFNIDRAQPSPVTGDGHNRLTEAKNSLDEVMQGVTPLTFWLAFEDAHSGVTSVEFLLVTPTGAAVTGLDNQVVRATCPAQCSGFEPAAGPGVTHANVSFLLNHVPVGTYRVSVNVTDGVGNRHDFGIVQQDIQVRPRLHMTQSERYPFAENNLLDVQMFAAFDGKFTNPPNGGSACPTNRVCRVKEVAIFARNITEEESQAKHLRTVVFPASGPSTHERFAVEYYDYSPANRLDFQGLNETESVVRAVATVEMQDGTLIVTDTPWIRVRSGLRPGGLDIRGPSDNQTVFMDGTPGTVNFNVTFEQAGLPDVPVLAYTLFATNGTHAGKYVRLNSTTTHNNPYWTPVPIQLVGDNNDQQPTGPRYFWNWTNSVQLPAGEYILDVSITNVAGYNATRFFGVEDTPVDLTDQVSQPEIFQERYVKRTFNISLHVDHGFANVSSTSFIPRLVAPNQFGGTRTLAPGMEGFNAVVEQLTPAADQTTTGVKYTITLPSNATNGARYELVVNVSTESWGAANASGMPHVANDSITRIVILDAAAPTAHTNVIESGNTGINKNSELKISGTAGDSGTGVGTMEVRIVNVNTSKTFVWNFGPNGTWMDGVRDSWMTSAVGVVFWNAEAKFVRNVNLALCHPKEPHVSCWGVNDATRPILNQDGTVATPGFTSCAAQPSACFAPIGLDRNHTYRVDVRAVDNVGIRSDEANFTVRFDGHVPVTLPNITVQLHAPQTHNGQPNPAWDRHVDWHGAGILNVTVQDNHCVKRVSLVGTLPNGSAMTRVDFPQPGVCPGRDQPSTWTLDLAQAPAATQYPGWYNYTVEVEDAAGNTRRGASLLQMRVNDTQRALVREVTPEAPIVGVDTRSAVTARIEEWAGMDHVLAIFSRYEGSSLTTLGQANMRLDPSRPQGNGTFWYVAATDTDLNITKLPVGDYAWTIRAYDANFQQTCAAPYSSDGCHQLLAIVRVSADAGPSIVVEEPSAGTEWINATPTFRWRIFNYNAGAGGITIRAGDALDNLTDAPLTSITPLTNTAGNTTGALVTFRPTNVTDNYTVRIRAVASNGFENTSTVGPFKLDAVAPLVTSNVTGRQTVNNESWAVAATRVTLAVEETGSGLESLTYRVNGGDAKPYAGPITPEGSTGDWRLAWTAKDEAGNVATGELTLKIDRTGPTVRVAREGDDMLLVVEDAGAGVDADNVTVHYAYGDATEYSVLRATRQTTTTSGFEVNLGGNAAETGLRYYVVARDLLGNVGGLGNATSPLVVGEDPGPITTTPPPTPTPTLNHAPVVRILRPTPNQQVGSDVVLQWEATDEDGDSLQVSLALQRGSSEGETLQNNAGASGSFPMTLKEPGPYTFLVVVSDGQETVVEQVAFTVAAAKPVSTVTPPPPTVDAGKPAAFSVRVNPGDRTVKTVSYIIERGGQQFASGLLTRSGDVYSGSFTTNESGTYEVLVVVTYEQGAPDAPVSLGTISVKGAAVTPGPEGGLSAAFIAMLALAVVTMGLAAGGAFWRWKK